MGATSPKVFPMPGSYAMDNENVVAPQDPVPQAPQQQFVSSSSYSGTGDATPANPVGNIRKLLQGAKGNNKFFGDRAFTGPDYQQIKNPNGQF